jgi:hypothetical protein
MCKGITTDFTTSITGTQAESDCFGRGFTAIPNIVLHTVKKKSAQSVNIQLPEAQQKKIHDVFNDIFLNFISSILDFQDNFFLQCIPPR